MRVTGDFDPFGDDLDDHFLSQGDNLVNLLDRGEEESENKNRKPKTTNAPVTTSSSGNGNRGNSSTSNSGNGNKGNGSTSVSEINNNNNSDGNDNNSSSEDGSGESGIVSSSISNDRNIGSSNNATGAVNDTGGSDVAEQSLKRPTIEAGKQNITSGESGKNANSTNIEIVEDTSPEDDVEEEVIDSILSLAEDKESFVDSTVKDTTTAKSKNVVKKEKFVSKNGIVVMGADGNSTKSGTAKIGNRNVKVKQTKAVHFKIMGTDDAEGKAAHGGKAVMTTTQP